MSNAGNQEVKKPASPKRSVGQRMGMAAIILAISIFLSRILGFLREAVIAYTHGAGTTTDAYYAAFQLPDLMNYFLAGGTLSITFIPLFSAYIARNDEEGAWRLFSTIATTMGLVLCVIAAVGWVIAPWFVPLFFPGFTDPAQIELAVAMTRIVIPAQLAFYFGGLIQGSLFVREVFWPSAVAPLVYNFCIIAGGVLLEPFVGIQGFAIGVVVGAILGPFLIPLWAARRDLKYRFRFAPLDRDFRAFVILTLPLMIGVSLVTVDEWLLRYFGSLQGDGAITWLNNSRKLMLVIFAVIGQAAGQAALPFLSRLYHEGKEVEMGNMLSASLQRVSFFSLIGTAGLLAASFPMVYLIFQRGQYTPEDAHITAVLLCFFAIGLVAWSVQTLAVRGFYARKDTLTPMIVGTITVLLAIPVYFVLNEHFGIIGLAAATSVGISLNALATIIVYRWRAGTLPLRPIFAGCGRGILHGAPAGLAAWGVLYLWAPPQFDMGFLPLLGLLSLMGLAFFLVLGATTSMLKPPEMDIIWRRLQKRLPWFGPSK